MTLSHHPIKTAITPLRMIFWGGLICVFDVTFSRKVNGEGWKFDFLNDLVGMLMITWGVCQLAKISVHERYRIAMIFVIISAFLSCFDALHSHLIYDTPKPLSFMLSMIGVFAMAATVVFCVAMRWLCQETGLERSEQSWKTTTWLFVWIYLIPLGLFYSATAISIATGSSFHFNLGPLGLLLLPVFCLPLIFLFLSTSRMKADAEES